MKQAPFPPRLDIALSLAIGVLAVTEVLTNEAISPAGPGLALELVLAAAVAWRRAAPLTAAVVVALGAAADAAIGVPPSEPAVPPVASVIVLYSIVSYAELPRAVAGSMILLAGATAQTLLGHQPAANLFFIYGLLGFAWTFGRIVRLRTSQAVSAELAVARLHRDLEGERRRVAEEERVRIARELHDVIAHSVSVMVVQAGAARRVLDRDPHAAARALDVIEETGREAVGELARLLGVLRRPSGDDAATARAPLPTLAQLPALVRAVDGSGPRVRLEVVGTPRALSSGVELTVFRIVQEALTNARKHAGPRSHAVVRLEYDDRRVSVEVVDDGAGGSPGLGTGHGLVGLHERVSSHHGTLTVGPRADASGGFRVHATIPVTGAT